MKCDQHFCNWVRNSQNPDHYVCLRCDKEKHINRSESGLTYLMIFGVSLFLVILMSHK
ncbi:MAG: hypothetical protein ACRCT1_16660 [Microcoleaceae cyanobacterium]|jgi:hypothetical protein